MTIRRVAGLLWAKPCEKPGWFRKTRPRGVKALGLRYERALAKALPQAKHGQWFAFEDANGLGWAQPDFLLETRLCVYVLESKLTETEQGRRQIDWLYRPLLEHYYKLPVHGIVVARHLTRETELSRVVDSLEGALCKTWNQTIPTLHWLGAGKL